jgi:hypothetical protein
VQADVPGTVGASVLPNVGVFPEDEGDPTEAGERLPVAEPLHAGDVVVVDPATAISTS